MSPRFRYAGTTPGVEIDGRLETRDRRSGVVAAGHCLKAELVFQKRQNGLAASVFGACLAAERSPHIVRLLPLMLILVQLLDVQQRVLVVGIDAG